MTNMKKKLRRSGQKGRKQRQEDQSEIIECVEEEEEREGSDCNNGLREKKSSSRKPQKSSKQVHIALLPDRYQPLEEDQTPDPRQGEEKKQKKLKRFRKNVGKALRYSWKCLVVGLQNFSSAYSGPLSAAATLVPEAHRTQP